MPTIRSFPAAAAAAAAAAVMEESKVYLHYNHTDACNLARWTQRESFNYMYARPWQKVVDFYSALVRGGTGSAALSVLLREKHKLWEIAENIHDCEEKEQFSLPTKERTGRWERVTFKIVLSYHGGSFDGWQKQPCLETVQGVVEKSLGRFVDERKAQQLKDKSLPIEGCAIVAGRTDKGVTALQQVCSFYTWRKDIKSGELKAAINEAAPGKLKALFISEVSRAFHPNFSAKWRRYFYIFPLAEEQEKSNCGEKVNIADGGDENQLMVLSENYEKGVCLNMSDEDETDDIHNSGTEPRSFSVTKVDLLLRQLEGKTLSYKMFARDTKASRSNGPPTECYMFCARAAETILPSADKGLAGLRVMCVELVANRFLRKMVRVLVATAIREAAAGADDDSLLKLMDATSRRATAPPAPPDGLCLVDVGYSEFRQENCLIQE